ncbi:MAG: spore protease YyaC [Clostridia bacterium]|nr:spore protease YyaC [Clostridia bacterium]
MEYAFHTYNTQAENGVATSLHHLLCQKKARAGTNLSNQMPVIVCVGSDLVIGDSLGPLTGDMLSYKTQSLGAYVYGTLRAPITAKEVKYLKDFLRRTHPKSPVIAVDAAVGRAEDVGIIKVTDQPLAPGSGANKQLGSFGDVTVLGVVAEKSAGNHALFNNTRLRLVYEMASQIAEGIATLLYDHSANAYHQNKAL